MNEQTIPIKTGRQHRMALTEPCIGAAMIAVAVPIGAAVAGGAISSPKLPPFQGD
jgi:hypothetical protein